MKPLDEGVVIDVNVALSAALGQLDRACGALAYEAQLRKGEEDAGVGYHVAARSVRSLRLYVERFVQNSRRRYRVNGEEVPQLYLDLDEYDDDVLSSMEVIDGPR